MPPRSASRWLPVLLLSGATIAQRPLPDPVGVVLDEAQAPVAGARVWLELGSAAPHLGFAARDLLSRQPLPESRTDDAGQFVLCLTPDQRALGSLLANVCLLVVEKEGYQDWVETVGLDTYLGSRVSLHRLTAAERVEVSVAEPRPSMAFVTFPGTSSVRPVWHEVVAGRATVAAPFAASPLVCTGGTSRVPAGVNAQLVYPGRSTVARLLVGGAGPVRWDAAPAGGVRSRKVTRPDGGPIERLRGLYRTPGGSRWFELTSNVAPEDAACTLIAVHAAGCTAVLALGDAALELAPPPAPCALIKVFAADGTPLAGARAELHPLVGFPYDHPFLRTRRVQRVIAGDDDGVIRFGAPLGDEPVLLRVLGPGHAAGIAFEPRRLGAHCEIRLPARAYGAIALTVDDPAGAPVAGAAAVVLTDGHDFRPRLPALPRTDETGRVKIDWVAAGMPKLRVIAPGYHELETGATVTGGATTDLRVTLARCVDVAVAAVDAQGVPQPFAQLRVVANGGAMYLLRTDSLGRGLARNLPANTALSCGPLISPQPPQPVLDPAAVQRVTVNASLAAVVHLEPGTRIVSESTHGPLAARDEVAACLLLHWDLAQNVQAFFGTERGPPVRVQSQDFDASRPGSLAVLDRTAIVRRVPIGVVDEHGTPVNGFRIVPQTKILPIERVGDLTVRDGDATFFVARDRHAWQCLVTHQDFLPGELEVPAAAKAEPQLAVVLQRGAPATFRATIVADATPQQVWWRLQRPRDSTIVDVVQDVPAGESKVVWRAPFALSADAWTVFASCNDQRVERKLVVKDAAGIEVDVGAIPAKASR